MSDSSENRPWWEGNYVWHPSGEEEVLPSGPSSRPPAPPTLTTCWRCSKEVPEEPDGRCIFCRADLHRMSRAATSPSTAPNAPVDTGGLMPMIWFYIGILSASIVQGLLMRAFATEGGMTEQKALTLIAVIEIIDTLLVLIAVAVVVAPPKMPRRTDGEKVLAWAFALPVLALLLGLNLAYHEALQKAIGINADHDLTFGKGPWSPIILLMVCLQPAVIEELFFRYLALGTLRRHMGIHGAVLISSVMFGLAHVGVPLSMPILCVIGVGLGYIRVASRSLVLPMILHFLHNLVILHL